MSGSSTPFVSPSSTPATMSRASSSSGQSDPSSSAMAPSRSWQRLTPQSTFVNGRGNVQQAAAATHYVPQGGAGPGGSVQGSPVLGPPVQQQGQQVYVRREPSPAPSSSRRGSEGSALQLDGVGETTTLPTQFGGVRQRVAIKTSSRPPAPRSSLTPQRRSSAMSASLSAEGRPASGAGAHSPSAGSPSLNYYPTSAASVRSASLQPPSPHGSIPALGSTTPASARSPSPSPSARSAYSSILDRPRPRTPVPSASPSLHPSRSPSPTVCRSSFASSNGGGSGTVTPTPSAPSSAQKTSILDRPRPKTPDTTGLFRFGERDAGAIAGGSRPRTPDTRPKTPDGSSVFAFSAPDTGDAETDQKEEEERRPAKRSVLDRPRPGTPDSQAWLDGARTAQSSSKPPFASGAGPSSASSSGRFVAAQHHRPSGSGTTTSGFSSSKGGSFDSLGPTVLSASTQASTTATSARPSLDSNPTSASASAGARSAPLLDFNFDFGSSFGSTETMFGLSDLLKLGTGSIDKEKPTSPPSSASRPLFSPADSATAQPSQAPTSSPVPASVPHTRTASPASSAGNSGFLSLSGAPGSAQGRTTSRKEPPKVDLQLELELELERAIPPHRPIASDVPRASFSSSAGTEDELSRRAPRGHASVSSIGSTAASGRSASVSGASVFSMGLGGGAGSSPRPKRRRRKSLASLLSLGSFSQSGHGGAAGMSNGQDPDEDDEERDLARKVPLAPPILPPVASTGPPMDLSSSAAVDTDVSSIRRTAPPPPASFAPFDPSSSSSLVPPFGELSLDKTLPPTPAGGPSSSPSAQGSPQIPAESSQGPPDSPTKRSFGTAVDAANKGLTRQLSKLRNRGASSSSASDARARNPNFQVISATTTRRPSQQHERKASVTSLQTADSHASHKPSLDCNGYPVRAPSSASGPPPVAASSSSVPIGRRLVDRLTKGGSSKSTAAAATQQASSWTMPLRDHSDEPAPARRMGRRRGSFSSLLGVGGSSASAAGHGSSAGGPKKILGMSLPAGRRSDDLLSSGRGDRGDGGWPMNAPPIAQQAPERGSRRSFDLLTDRATIPRRPSTDNLLTLATTKLSSLAVSSQTADASTASPSAQASTVVSAQPSATSSGMSTPAEEADDKPEPTIATAAVVNLTEATPVAHTAPEAPNPPPQPPTTRTLARSDSLQGRRPRPIESGTEVPALPPGPALELAHPGNEARPRPRAPPEFAAPPAPPVVPLWRAAAASDAPAGSLEKRMTRAWLELEDALQAYGSPAHDRVAIINGALLPFMRHEEGSPSPKATESLSHRRRDILFGWLDVLLHDLIEMQAGHRGSCIDGIIAIAESTLLSHEALKDDPQDQHRYRWALLRMLNFAIEKLNHKAVYANVLAFSSRVFALAFFRLEGVALKLLRSLPPVKRQGLKRILEEAGVNEHELPPVDEGAFPEHLSSLCLRDFRTYASLLSAPMAPTLEPEVLVEEGDIKLELTGNWLIRWQASDSDLSFAFYRAYQRQLAMHLLPSSLRASAAALDSLPPSAVMTAPGYLFLAASLLEKVDSLVHRSMRTATSIGAQSGNFNTNDSANLSFGQKPKVLELAQRRVVATLSDIVGGPPSALLTGDGAALDAVGRRYLYGGMLQVWVRACVKRTSLWDVRGVFLVSDLIESLMYTLAYSTRGVGDEDETPVPDEGGVRLFDFPFLFKTVRLILEQADNTVTIMRTIALLYSNFDALTFDPEHRTELCEKIILDETLFQRMLLHYYSGVRGYWIRLLVWRLSRLGKAAQERNPDQPPDEGIVALFSLLNVRLEAVRKRHDQLEPMDNLVEDESFFRPKRSTICSTRGVKEAPWTVDALGGVLNEESDDDDEGDDDNAQELVRSVPSPSVASNGGRKHDLKTVAKVVSWLKSGLGKKQGKGSRGAPDDTPVDPFFLEQSDSARSSESTDRRQLRAPPPLPTTIETGLVTSSDSPGPHTPDAPVRRPSASSSRPARRPRPKSGRAERRRSLNPAFFAFEFENGVVTRTDVDPTVASSGASTVSVSTTGSGDTTFPSAPIRPRQGAGPSALSPRVSLRFSKRLSILPPAALDLLKEAHGSEPVPAIPERFRESVEAGYDKKLHPYAVRGLRDYEDALEEWADWVTSLEEEEGDARANVDVVPRLGVSWPLSGTDE